MFSHTVALHEVSIHIKGAKVEGMTKPYEWFGELFTSCYTITVICSGLIVEMPHINAPGLATQDHAHSYTVGTYFHSHKTTKSVNMKSK